MTQAICFSCGLTKTGPFSKCPTCSKEPQTKEDLALSLALSSHLASTSQLIHFGHEIRSHLRSSIPQSLLDQAEEALRDPQLTSMLNQSTQVDLSKTKSTGAATPERIDQTEKKSTTQKGVQFRTQRSIEATVFDAIPFALLGATLRDDRKKIMDLAEEKSLEVDAEVCQKARSDLINPRTRLAIEMAWLPGVSPRRATQLMEALKKNPLAISTEDGLPDLAYANLIAASFVAINDSDSSQEVSRLIQHFCEIVEYISADEILRDLNEDRAVSGFPEVKGLELIEEELANRRRYYQKAVSQGLNNLSPEKLVKAITEAVNEATIDGLIHAPTLLDEIVDGYELEVGTFLAKEEQNIELLVIAVKNQVKSGEVSIQFQIDKLEKVLRNWDRIVKPIQVSAKARGLDHEASKKVGYQVRGLAIELFNEHDFIRQSQRITQVLTELFSEISEISERVEKDAVDLQEISNDRKKEEKKQAEFDKDITFKAEVGMMFKDELEIGPNGVVWKDKRFPLASITAIKWGAVRNSVNGIPTGTDYWIGIADRSGSTNIHLRKEATYDGFVNALWKAVGVRLLIDMLGALKKGQSVTIGNMLIEDTHVTLTRHKFLGSEKVRVGWGDVTYQSYNGKFFINHKSDKKVDGSASFGDDWNTHILESAVRGSFKKWTGKLSGFLG